MPTRGRGMSTGYRLGDHNALCDRCQKKFFASDLKKEWTGWYVCDSCYEPRHPQEFLKGHRDDPQVAWTRPDRADIDVDINGDISKALTHGTDSDIQEFSTTLTEDRVARLDTTNAQRGDRFIIYKMVDDGKTLYITSTVLDSGTSV